MKKQALYSLLLTGMLLFYATKQFGQSTKPSEEWTLRRKTDTDGFIRCGEGNKYDSALFFAKDIEVAALKEFGDTSLVHGGALCSYLGYIYILKGDYPNAYSCLKKGLDIWDRVTDSTHFGYNDAVFRLGVTARELGLRAEAEKYLYRANLLFNDSDKQAHAQNMLLLASNYLEKGNYEKAISLNMAVNDMLDTIHNIPFIDYLKASVYNNMAVIYSQTGNWEKVLSYLQKTIPLAAIAAKNTNTKDEYQRMILNLAETYINYNLLDSAMAKCKEVERDLRINKNDLINAVTLVIRAKVYEQKKELSKALHLMQQYKAIADTLPIKPSTHDENIIELGMLYTASKQYATADSLFRQEIEHLHQSGLDFSYQMQLCKYNLCVSLMNQKKYAEASDSLVQLVQLTLRNLKQNFIGMSENELLQYKKGLDAVFDLLYTCICINENINKNILTETGKLELERENMVLTTQTQLLNKARNTTDTAFSIIYSNWLNNRQLLAHQYALPIDERLFKVDSLEEICNILEKKMSLTVFSPKLIDSTIFTKSVFNNIYYTKNPRSCSIAFVRFNYIPSINHPTDLRYAAFIYQPANNLPIFVRLCNETILATLFKNDKGKRIDATQLTEKIYNIHNSTSILLYQMLWQPLQPFLKGMQHVNYSTAGMLNNIAFQALYNGKNYLYQQYGLRRYLNLLDAAKQQEPNQAKGNITIWGNMDYDIANYDATPITATQAHVSILPSSIVSTATKKGIFKERLQLFDTIEISNLKKICTDTKTPFTSFEKQIATEDKFKQQAASAKGILHISTHGFYTPFQKQKQKDHNPIDFMASITNPLFRCGLAFSGVNNYWLKGKTYPYHDDGILTGYEISQLDLHQAQLVILSACETGLGDITDDEGNIGLQRAFKLAGAGKLLVSLWQVPAKQTAELFSLFYTNWLNGLPPNKALELAQDVLQKKHYPAYYWAGFVLIE